MLRMFAYVFHFDIYNHKRILDPFHLETINQTIQANKNFLFLEPSCQLCAQLCRTAWFAGQENIQNYL